MPRDHPTSIGVATIRNMIHYSDSIVTCSPIDGSERLIPDVHTILEVVSAISAK